MAALEELRERLDEIDCQIADLYEKRMTGGTSAGGRAAPAPHSAPAPVPVAAPFLPEERSFSCGGRPNGVY